MLIQLLDSLRYRTMRRPPDRIIGGEDDPYMLRWYVLIPRNRFFSIYLHCFKRSDDDRALHDHPWAFNASIIIKGRYMECAQNDVPRMRTAGDIKVRFGKSPHRIELIDGDCWTLFICGPVVRKWGFYCPQGWRHWREFTNPVDGGSTIGKSCD